MKNVYKFIALILVFGSISLSAVAQQNEMPANRQHMMSMMQDTSMQNMMMNHIAENPEMRSKMMKALMNSGNNMSHGKMMEKMKSIMNNPEMKDRMQKHMAMMQSMMNEEMDHSKMMENSSMMKMHLMCMQMMSTGMMKSDSENGQGMMDHK